MRVPGWPAWPHTARPARGEPGRHSASALLPRGGAHQARPAWVTIIHGPQDTLSLHINTDARHGHWRGGASICRERGGGNLALSPTCMGTTMRDDDWIEIYDFNSETLTLHYGCKEGTYREFKIKVIDNKTNFIIHQELMQGAQGRRFWTNFGYCENFIYDAVRDCSEDPEVVLDRAGAPFYTAAPNLFSRRASDVGTRPIRTRPHRGDCRCQGPPRTSTGILSPRP